ncbi:MAG: DUF1893 domain-containing protein [Acutalibacteraceae bacterium]
MDKKQLIKSKIEDSQFLCFAVLSDGSEYSSERRGIAPLLLPIKNNRRFFDGAFVGDKIIGKAAAELLVYSGAKYVYAKTISRSAKAVFDTHGVEYDYSVFTESIVNRNGDGPCPMEQAVAQSKSLDESFDLICLKYEMLTKNK